MSFGQVEEMDGGGVEVDVEAVLGSLCQYSASRKMDEVYLHSC